MASSKKNLIVLENSLSNRVFNAWKKEIDPIRLDLIDALERKDITEASRLVDQIEVVKALEGQDGFFESIGVSSLLVGASNILPMSKVDIAGNGELPDVFPYAIALFKKIVSQAVEVNVKKQIYSLIDDVSVNDPLTPISKAESVASLADKLNAAVLGTGKSIVDIGANLTTSRLVSYGMLAQAEISGYREFQVKATLDHKTSEFCRRMHGRVFKVEDAIRRLETVLRVDNPDDLKLIAPFPKTTKAALKTIEDSSNADLQEAGFDTPPYHPHCRTVIVLVGEVDTSRTYYTPIKLGEKEKPTTVREIASVAPILAVVGADFNSRASSVLAKLTFLSIDVEKKQQLVDALENATDLDDLSAELKKLFLEIEKQLSR